MSQVSLTILEPRGVLEDPKRVGLSAPRLDTLNGKTIALMSINIPGRFGATADPFFDVLERKLLERYPEAKFLRMDSFGTPVAPPSKALEVAAQCDAWIEGVKDSHSQARHDAGVCMEQAGRPGVSLSVDVLIRAKQANQDINGMPAVRIATVPATDYCAAKYNDPAMERVVDGCIDDIIYKLTAPLTDEEKRSYDMPNDQSPKTFEGASYGEAYEKFLEYLDAGHLYDGHAVAPPTPEAVDWMLTGTTYPRDKVIGMMEPKRGCATVEKIAIAAVMAGAKPEHLPLLIAIIETLTDPGFNQFHVVNEILPAIFVSGPLVKELGLNTKVGYLAPGFRPNSSIGRAVLMCMITIGWRDMTIYASPGGPGRPAAYGNIFVCENQEDSPWESFAEQYGYGPDETVVTACEYINEARGPAESLGYGSFEERLASVTALFGRNCSVFGGFGLPRFAKGQRHMLVMHPTLARQLAEHGFTKRSFVEYCYNQNAIDYDTMTEEQREALREELRKDNAVGRMGLTPEDVKPGLHREPFSQPEHLMVFVSGSGSGNTNLYETSSGSSAGQLGGLTESRPWMIKVVHGAALTKYGK
ncbi:MAG: hypothetical protein J6P71_04550 [Oscillospiraceae bacterium]|nr:hypothetical protein [Oscillospiraceae bacterium]